MAPSYLASHVPGNGLPRERFRSVGSNTMVSETLFNSNAKFLQPGYSCHLLTIELISERGYEVKFLLLLFRLGSSRGGHTKKRSFKCRVIQTCKGSPNPGTPWQRGSRSALGPQFPHCLHSSALLSLCYVCCPCKPLPL